MLYVTSYGVSHHDWFVESVPHGRHFRFRCEHPYLEGLQQDGSIYPTCEAALIAGCQFVDREMAISALINALEELMSKEKISLDEYWNLANFSNNNDLP